MWFLTFKQSPSQWTAVSTFTLPRAMLWFLQFGKREEGSGEKHMALQGKNRRSVFPASSDKVQWLALYHCEGSGLDSSAWKAAFHPISSHWWVLGVFMVRQQWHFLPLLFISKSVCFKWPGNSINPFLLRSKSTWFINVFACFTIISPVCCKVGSFVMVTHHMTFSKQVGVWWWSQHK